LNDILFILLIIFDSLLLIHLYLNLKYKINIFEYLYFLRKIKKKSLLDIFNNKEIVVYRIEHSINGIGPYRNKEKISNEVSENKPYPIDDFLIEDFLNLKYKFILHKMFFGFESKESLFNWFSKEEINFLLKRNYKIKEFKTSKYIKGKKQILFLK